MSVFLSPVGGAGAQFFDNNGNPLSGGKLYTYLCWHHDPTGHLHDIFWRNSA